MPSGVVEDFGRSIVEHVRDRAILDCRVRLQANAKAARSKKWRELVGSGDCDELLRTVIPDVVDETITCLLDAIDNRRVRLAGWDENGNPVDLAEVGLSELAGWYIGGDWPKRYSKEPFVDPNDEV